MRTTSAVPTPRYSRKADPSLHIRRANVADIPAIRDLDRRSPTAAHWSVQQYDNLLVTANNQSQGLLWVIEKEREAQPDTPAPTPEILGFLVAHRIEHEWELENIVVAEAARQHGLGSLLMSTFVAHVRAEHGTGIFLEVRASNQTARTLYRRVGFEETGTRKNYYCSPLEDAILCRLSLS
jgi:[ribosomal protein S18]-alanine N-acetyltransferase